MENYSSSGKSAIGLDANLAAALGYPIGILGLINFFIDKDNNFVRFHGIQSVLYSAIVGAVFTIIWIVLAIFGMIASQISGALAALIGIVYLLLFLVFLVAWFGVLLYSGYRAYQGQTFKLPVVGNFAEKIVNK
jgi:uncharacterized membrane protein